MPRIFEVITIFAKNFEKRMYSPREVIYISSELVYFPMNQNEMVTRNWRQQPAVARILMPNVSLETCFYITSVKKRLQEQKKTSAWVEG